MNNHRPKALVWILGLLATVLILATPALYLWYTSPDRQAASQAAASDPAANLPQRKAHTDHSSLFSTPFASGPEVTQACLSCHPGASSEVMKTSHWTWESAPVNVDWRDEPVTVGKKNQINNFCIGTQGNEKKCMTCHAGYGWESAETFDFSEQSNVDCLVCHADPNTYAKGVYGLPAEGIDLLVAAQSVRTPSRENCGGCHFNGGGGNNVKHGDLDQSLNLPSDSQDVHMGGQNFLCVDCHQTTEHAIKGRLVVDNIVVAPQEQVACTDCHAQDVHTDERLNQHTVAVACQTCHVPEMAVKDPTKTSWDWSTAGQDQPEDHFTYLKIKGTFTYEENVKPSYIWFNGNLDYRYLLGDTINLDGPTMINQPSGSIRDPQAKIFPFKIHIAKQPYDTVYNYLLQPRTGGGGNGGGGFWETFDWPSALALGAQDTDMQFSGEYGFTETWMYWPTTHMVQPKEQALRCDSCHNGGGRLDWQALGYPGDPMEWGGRASQP